MLRLFTKRRTYDFVFIFTYGRSGSTLLMGLLNSLPNYCLRGENGNVLHRLYQAYEALRAARSSPSAKNARNATHPWFGLLSADPERFRQRLVDAFVDEVLAPGDRDRTIGFKEIRFSKEEIPDFEGYVEFVRTSFPGCRIVINHRNLDNVAASAWWSNMPKAREKLQFMEDRFNSVPAGSNVFHFYYDRIGGDLDHVRELFAFLGEGFDETSVRSVLSVRHSY